MSGPVVSAERFGRRLAAVVAAQGTLCAGIDPHPGLLRQWQLTDDADGLDSFATACFEAFAGHVGVVKPQSAFFERHGSAGIAVLERLLDAFAATSTLVILDVKRGDIGTTMDGYAGAYLAAKAPLGADAVTLSPYLGFGALAPGMAAAAVAGRGVFVLARTSNPEGGEVQLATTAGRTVAQAIVDAAGEQNAGRDPLGDVGVVVGATRDHGLDLSRLRGAVLAPGLGA
ncbi:MAG: orotidine-5'-phosphate decarboxylase, partial [Pseudonocardia sp.]|nr:orotidine-5'-phosphate decarboxylase [Pseudonocardia sp.]